jgi:hypothetical protein
LSSCIYAGDAELLGLFTLRWESLAGDELSLRNFLLQNFTKLNPDWLRTILDD